MTSVMSTLRSRGGFLFSDPSDLIDDLQVLVDPDPPSAVASIDVTGAVTLDQVQYRLCDYFAATGAPDAVTVMVGNIPAGVVTRESLEKANRTAAKSSTGYQVGAGERIQLPGESASYRLLEFSCSRCHNQAFRIYYDERILPTCPTHGQMELKK